MTGTSRPGRILAVAGCLAACTAGTTKQAANPVQPAVVAYAPFAAAYEVATHGRVDQAFNDRVATTEFAMRLHLATRVDSSGGSLRAAITVDSILAVSGAAIGYSLAEARLARGTTFRGELAAGVGLRHIAGGDTAMPFVRQLRDRRLPEFFPRIPRGGVRPGQRWTDTTESTTSSNGLDLATRSINRHEAVGWEPMAVTTALLIVTTSGYSVSGRGLQSGHEIVLDGTGTRIARALVDGAGRYLAMTAHDTTRVTATLPAVGDVIPITQSQVDTLRLRS